ncbi:unnamed protein product [Eruca vesicaria subsp. sativa]|uniref:BZIP domain-containing protein n=1 Tax=Eruca vesicaria subsp. sativa TaxID=29727 RepID=A0ABC8KWS6_ERUVS|nr:unnamed protein product [Eruca vesicaria subsp. sativa]
MADNSSFDQALLGSSIDVDFELTFDDLYFPSENESFFIPVDATNLEVSGDCSATATVVDVSEATIASSSELEKVVVDRNLKVEEEATTYKTKRKREEDTSLNNKYRRSNEDGAAASCDEEGYEKRNARLVRNRESAHLSRQRKKHYVEELEEKVKNLQSVITDLNSKVDYFMSENVTLRHKVGPGKGMCWPPSGIYPMPYPWMQIPPYMVKPQGCHQVVPMLPIPRLKPQQSFAAKVKNSEAKTKKVASVSVLGLLFCLFLLGALAPIVNVSFKEWEERDLLDSSVNSSCRSQCGRGSDQGVGRSVSATVNSVPLGNSSELIVASLFVPRNKKLVKLDGNLIIHSLSASEKDMASETKPALRSSDSTRTRDMPKQLKTEKREALSSSGSDDSKDQRNSTTANGEMQQWFREGVAGPMFSSGMCTEVFQFDVSSNSGAIIPATQHPKNTTNKHKGNNNRRILRGGFPVSDLTKDQNSSNKDNFGTTKPFPSMVVSILTDPREEGSDGDMAGGRKSLSHVFIVVLVDGVKYVTYSCVLPPPEEVPHLVTT